jgi:uncharacterized membrane protein YdjX (TVP38/TMEM64 family)
LKNRIFSRLSIPAFISVTLAVLPLLTTSLLTAWAIGHESLLTIASSVALTPPTFLALVYGYFLGWVAFPLLFFLNLGAITSIYVISRMFRADKVRFYLTEIYPQVDSLLKRFQENELRLIFFAKLSPMLPFAVTNLFFAMAGARLKQMLAGGSFGMIPRTILAIWAGKEARDIRFLLDHPDDGLGAKIALILLILASTIGMGYFFRDKSVTKQ